MNNTAATLILLDPGKLGGGIYSLWFEDGSFSFFYFSAECGSCNQGIDASRPGCLASGQTSDQVIINLQRYQQIFPELQYNIFAREVLPPRLLQVPGLLSRDPGRLLHHRDQPRLSQLLQGGSSKSRKICRYRHNVIVDYFSVQSAWNHWRGSIFHARTSFSVRKITRYAAKLLKWLFIILSIQKEENCHDCGEVIKGPYDAE